MKSKHLIHCLQCGDLFEGDGSVVFCGTTCKDKYDEYERYKYIYENDKSW